VIIASSFSSSTCARVPPDDRVVVGPEARARSVGQHRDGRERGLDRLHEPSPDALSSTTISTLWPGTGPAVTVARHSRSSSRCWWLTIETVMSGTARPG
jgi:hypothetical protein